MTPPVWTSTRPLAVLGTGTALPGDPVDNDILFARVRALKARASFIYVSHRLDEVLELSDRIYVMKDGAVVR